jgi:hypothetical protein
MPRSCRLDFRLDGMNAAWVWFFSGERASAAAALTAKTGSSHISAARTKSYGVDAATMHLEQHERGIHIV